MGTRIPNQNEMFIISFYWCTSSTKQSNETIDGVDAIVYYTMCEWINPTDHKEKTHDYFFGNIFGLDLSTPRYNVP